MDETGAKMSDYEWHSLRGGEMGYVDASGRIVGTTISILGRVSASVEIIPGRYRSLGMFIDKNLAMSAVVREVLSPAPPAEAEAETKKGER